MHPDAERFVNPYDLPDTQPQGETMNQKQSFQEWFSKRSGTRDHMTVPLGIDLPCGCKSYAGKNGHGETITKVDGSWFHDCKIIKVESTIIVRGPRPHGQPVWWGGPYD